MKFTKKEFEQIQNEYSVNKFGKNRSVDHRYLNVPVKYIVANGGFNGANCDSPDKFRTETFEEWKKRQEEWLEENPIFKKYSDISKEEYESWKKNGLLKEVLVKEGRDKTLCIVDFYGKNKALVAWRNNRKCKMGMTHICPIIYKNKNCYIVYRGKEILISDDSGWVW